MTDDHLNLTDESDAARTAAGTTELAARTERLESLYDAAVKTLFWGFRLGAAVSRWDTKPTRSRM
jgi:hypothetical protein